MFFYGFPMALIWILHDCYRVTPASRLILSSSKSRWNFTSWSWLLQMDLTPILWRCQYQKQKCDQWMMDLGLENSEMRFYHVIPCYTPRFHFENTFRINHLKMTRTIGTRPGVGSLNGYRRPMIPAHFNMEPKKMWFEQWFSYGIWPCLGSVLN